MNNIPDTILIENLSHEDGKIEVVFQLNADNSVFKGHFPGQPVLPGVIQMQLIRKVLQQELAKSLQLLNAPAVKFLTPIVPGPYPTFLLKISYAEVNSEIHADAEIRSGETVFMKLKSKYVQR